MPVGYALLAAAAALTLVIATYVIAFQRGRTVGKADIKSQMISDLTGSGEQRVPNDPLYELNSTPAGGKSSTALPPGSNRKTSPTASNYQGRPTSSWGQVVADVKSDPRKKGLNYFVVIETQEAGARKVADFCRSNGLESYVVPGNNDRLRRAIILPGFEDSARLSPEVAALEQKITEVGRAWQRVERGNRDFTGFYKLKY